MEMDAKTELDWINKTIAKIEQGILQAENIDLDTARRTVVRIQEVIENDKRILEALKAKRIRLLAQMDEEKKSGEAK
jgi:hypothetical protein